jgi:GrpB-like predicted nucleotidyltransferase (UPF0157 family)
MREDPIVMTPYDPDWPRSFDAERRRIAPLLGQFLVRPIEHVGSTSVPGLLAKPIIDMVAVVRDIGEVSALREPLGRTGWVHAPEALDEVERRLSFCHPTIAHRTHHLHVVEESFYGWREWLAFRDYLRARPELCVEYGRLKQGLADEFGSVPNERDPYRSGKSAWVTLVTARALSDETIRRLGYI